LDEERRLAEEGPLSALPLRLNIHGDTLVVYCADNVIYHYGMHLNHVGTFDVSLRQHLTLSRELVPVPEQVLSVDWFSYYPGPRSGSSSYVPSHLPDLTHHTPSI
jgi:hypothetical protein